MSEAFESIKRGLEEALAHNRGEKTEVKSSPHDTLNELLSQCDFSLDDKPVGSESL